MSKLDCNEAHDAYMDDCVVATQAQLCVDPNAEAHCVAWIDSCAELTLEDCAQGLAFSARDAGDVGACFEDARLTGEDCWMDWFECL